MKSKRNNTLTIWPGCCYYDVSNDTPIGTRTFRAPEGGLKVNDVTRFSLWHGCNRTGYTTSGVKVSFHSEYTKEHYHND